MKRIAYIQALRELAEYLESHDIPDTALNRWTGNYEDVFPNLKVEIYVEDKELFGRICSKMGAFKKEVSDYSTGAFHELPNGSTFGVKASRRTVCKRVVVGTKTVKATEEKIIPAEPEHEEDIVKWECPESFIDLKEETTAHES